MGNPVELTQEMQERLGLLCWYSQVGRCVNSVAHDVNNYLGGVMAYAELLEMSNIDDDSRRMATQITDATRKCSSLLGSLTSVARKSRSDARLLEIEPFINEVLDLKRYDFRVARVRLDAQFDSPIPSIVIDRPKMAMALIHLLTNSLDIVGQTENAFTRISVKNHSDAVEVIVENSGPMIPDSECERIFDFMYTTKGAEHMGLGLSLARGIARLHNGDLTYDPQRGFVLRIPHETNLQIS